MSTSNGTTSPRRLPSPATLAPLVALVVLALAWGRDLHPLLVAAVTVTLAGAVLAAVHHAEVVAHKVGEPFGSLVLAGSVPPRWCCSPRSCSSRSTPDPYGGARCDSSSPRARSTTSAG